MRSRLSRIANLYGWLDERSGVRNVVRYALDEPIRGGARWVYVFGSTLVFLFALQVITGICLTMYYVPSADHAHRSVAYIQKAVPGGALIRGLHYHGASAMVVMMAAHMAQTFLFGAYKGKRELVWVVGGLIFLLTLGFAFTGFLLPWDQEAYFSTQVGTSVAGEIPAIGYLVQRIMLGGTELTSLTLSRFFMVHALLLPLAVGLLVLLHVYLFRRAGAAGPYHNRDDERMERFYPKQLLKDSIFILLVFVVLVVLASALPARLGPQADPTADFLARPAWYFLPLFELLKYFPGKLSLIPTVVLPGVLLTLIFLLPFFDRRQERHPLRRPVATAVLVFMFAGSVGLMVISKYEDRSNPEFRAKLEEQEQEAGKFLRAAFQPQEIGRSSARTLLDDADTSKVYFRGNPPPAAYAVNCAGCHGDRGEGDLGPVLVGVTLKPNRSTEDLLKLLDDARAYGLKKPMPQSFPKISDADKRSVVEWLNTLKH